VNAHVSPLAVHRVAEEPPPTDDAIGLVGSVLLLGGTNAQVEVGRGLDRMRSGDFARAVVVEVVADTVLGPVGKA
jgi:hypothetical protein